MAAGARYSDRLTARICAELAAGVSVAEVCRQPWAPNEKTHYRWMAAHPEYRAAISSAKDVGCEKYADEIIRLADEAASPLLNNEGQPIKGANGPVMVKTAEATNHARLQIDARKWVLSKLLPKKYGDKVEHEHSGGVTVEVVRFSGEGQAPGK